MENAFPLADPKDRVLEIIKEEGLFGLSKNNSGVEMKEESKSGEEEKTNEENSK